MHFVSHLLSHSCGRAEQTNGGAATAGGGSPCHLAVPCLAVCGGAFSCGRVQAESMVWERTLRRTRPAKVTRSPSSGGSRIVPQVLRDGRDVVVDAASA
ncbi:hypothetical protein GQ55_2G190700 [Panicum hallii var. hallii]|uniref:Uncharacterized protein n=1 Tax=Panicum hallii var. hallii TaxID=1504633 RepID=A0A2T7EQD1_9POAL|nr:hypothetical protein GQ55_2G190700 [Panicum hallii var. hallii]